MAHSIPFENSAGQGSQAVALMSISNNSIFYKYTFLGYQDTLYARKGWQFYRECDIYGIVDFIFGDAAAVFQTCNIYARVPNRVIIFAAHGRKIPTDSKTGFSIQNCSITVSHGLEMEMFTIQGYLGRTWFNYSTVVVMESHLDSIIEPAGWLEWLGNSVDKLTCQEYNNNGPGANTSGRVRWSGYQVVNQADEARLYTVGNFIHGDTWIPATNIPYASGFILNT